MGSTLTAKGYITLIEKYFLHIQGEYHIEKTPAKGSKDKQEFTEQKIWDREAEPPTLTGLALYLGFNSRQEFEVYEQNGKFADQVKRGRLMIEAEYEKKLHFQAPTGAVFALKSLGWAEHADTSLADDLPKTLRIEIIASGPQLANDEKDVAI